MKPKITQKALAKLFGVSQTHLSFLLNRGLPLSPDIRQKAASYLKTPEKKLSLLPGPEVKKLLLRSVPVKMTYLAADYKLIAAAMGMDVELLKAVLSGKLRINISYAKRLAVFAADPSAWPMFVGIPAVLFKRIFFPDYPQSLLTLEAIGRIFKTSRSGAVALFASPHPLYKEASLTGAATYFCIKVHELQDFREISGKQLKLLFYPPANVRALTYAIGKKAKAIKAPDCQPKKLKIISRKKLAFEIGISYAQLKNIMAGKAVAGDRSCAKIAAWLGVDHILAERYPRPDGIIPMRNLIEKKLNTLGMTLKSA